MFKYLVVAVMLTLSIASNVIAADIIPRKEFIKYSDACIDVLDELERSFATTDITIEEADRLLDKYYLNAKKYDRYRSPKWNKKSLQYIIIKQTYDLNLEMRKKVFLLKLRFQSHEATSGDIEEVRQVIEKESAKIKNNLFKYRKAS